MCLTFKQRLSLLHGAEIMDDMCLYSRVDHSRGAGLSGGETSRRICVGFRIHGAVKKDGPDTWSFSHSQSIHGVEKIAIKNGKY